MRTEYSKMKGVSITLQNLELKLEKMFPQSNSELPITLMKFLMKGNRVTAITGSQGSGKTTLLMGLVEHIHKSLNLHIQETNFDSYLRSLYPNRNIHEFNETDTINGQNVLRKTDGSVNIFGEVLTDSVAARMIETHITSLFTVFTHHAKTLPDLVYAIRNSLLNVGMFSNEVSAQKQVVSFLEFDIHMRQDSDGSKYIERITECIPLTPQQDVVRQLTSAVGVKTQPKYFEARNLVEFENGVYVPRHSISKQRFENIERLLSEEERITFRHFVKQVWGDAIRHHQLVRNEEALKHAEESNVNYDVLISDVDPSAAK